MPILQRSELTLLVTGAAATVCLVVAKKDRLRETASSLCEVFSSRPTIASDVARDAFATIPVSPVQLTPGHTHPTAAALRTTATNFARDLATYCGAGLFVVEMSKSDQRKGLRGSRQWWWAKDVNADNRQDDPEAMDVRYICDVDYYLDMPSILASRAEPVVLYTVVPEEAVAKGTDDTSFRFDEDGALCTVVAGAGTYRHFLWDYAHDSLLACEKLFGLPIRVVSYSVERKQVGKHRQLILLSPMRVFNGVAAVLAYYLLEPKPLKRWNPIVRKGDQVFVRFDVHTSKDTMVTTARPNTWLCATVSADVDASIATVARLGTTNLMLPTAASWIPDDRAAAAVLTEYHRCCGERSPMVVYPVAHSVRAYQYKPREFDQDARPKLEAFMSPLVHKAFAPVMNKAGEEQSVEGRINKLKKPEPKYSRFVQDCISEFADLVLKGAVLEPVCYEVVANKQTSASQKLSLMKAVLNGPFRQLVLKCFGKAEAYPDIKDPRNISQYNDADKLDMAMIALALSEHLKQFAWYGPGKNPLEIAMRVAEICEGARNFVNISDYHRMDGTITYCLRQVDRAVCMKAFAHHRAKVNELLKTNVDNRGVLPLGTKFNQGPSHGSGCSATSVFQTLRAAFTAYLGFRNAILESGRHPTPMEAFASLGIHLGDDGLDADLPPANHQWAAEKVGLVLEAATVQRGFRGVNFLARYYSPEVWYGSLNSMCDIKRQLSKFHTTVRLPANVKPEQKLVEKAMSYVATDGNTPVIGEFCKRVLLLSSYRPRVLLGVGSWWSKFELSAQYPNEDVGGWMAVELAALFPEFDYGQFKGWLDSTKTAEDLLRAPICAEPEPATPTSVDVVVDDQVLKAREIVATIQAEVTEKKESHKTQRLRARKSKLQIANTNCGEAKVESPEPQRRSRSKCRSKTPRH